MFTHSRYPRTNREQKKDAIRQEMTSTGYIIWDGDKKVAEGFDYFEESKQMADMAEQKYRQSK